SKPLILRYGILHRTPRCPYTTRFRSVVTEPGEHTVDYRAADAAGNTAEGSVSFTVAVEVVEPEPDVTAPEVSATVAGEQDEDGRSEEHTSELQSRFDLVCRLLLEKKK